VLGLEEAFERKGPSGVDRSAVFKINEEQYLQSSGMAPSPQ